MIQAQELRIGNKVKDENGFIFDVVGLGKGWITVDFHGNEGDVWEFDFKNSFPYGILLTEEILLKCGFEKSTDGDHFFIGHYGFCFIHDGQDYCLKPLINEPMIVAYCRHLHQLQNIYYAITGQELTIKGL